MNKTGEYEEKYTSAYCRLSYHVWYYGFKDDITDLITNDESLYEVLRRYVREFDINEVIRINGVKLSEKIKIEDILKYYIKI